MKSVIIKLSVFVALFFAADFLMGWVVGYFYENSENINLRDANHGFLEDIEDDILIFGASELSHALISDRMTDKSGLETYNLACDACGIFYQYPLLETILEKHAPKAIIISSNQMNENDLRYVAKLYPFYRENGHVKEMVDELFPRAFFKLAIQGYVYNSKIIRVFDGINENLNGYVPLTPEESKTWLTQVDPLPQGKGSPISESTQKYFQKFVEKANAVGAKVYVCIPPILERMDDDYRNQMLSIVEDTDAKIIDLSIDQAVLEKRNLFFDRAHLNDDGAKVVTDKVLKVLKTDGVY